MTAVFMKGGDLGTEKTWRHREKTPETQDWSEASTAKEGLRPRRAGRGRERTPPRAPPGGRSPASTLVLDLASGTGRG